MSEIQRIADYLARWHVGEARAVGAQELTDRLRLPSDRALREALESVQERFPVVSTSAAGIYWCGCREDFEPALRQAKSNLYAYARRYRRMKRTRDRLYPPPDQGELF